MQRTPGQIHSSYQSFGEVLAKEKRNMQWLRFLDRNREVLNSISDIVDLGILWADYSLYNEEELKPQRLCLEYRGQAKKHEDARADLKRIRKALHCQTLKLEMRPVYTTNNPPEFYYEGLGRLGTLPVNIELKVRWYKTGCRVESYEQGTTREVKHHRSYRVVCSR